jgi:glucosylglycerate synthase
MAATQTLSDSSLPATPTSAGLLVSLGGLSPNALEATLANLALAFPDQPVLAASPDPQPSTLPESSQFLFTTYTPATPAPGGWILSAADFLNTWKLMQDHQSTTCLLLGPEAQSLAPEALRALADGVVTSGADLTTPRYSLGPRDSLVNSAILYPVTRALFGTRPRYPLAIDLAFSPRMAERLAVCAQKHTATNQNAALIWPVAEAAASGFSIAEVPAGSRALPPPDFADLNTLLAQVAGSFFADLDAKASFWQRARLAYPTRAAAESAPDQSPQATAAPEPQAPPDVQPMLDSFRLAYTNLHEIWSLVLPPNSLLGLKKLSLMSAADFRMPDSLWVRIVYDFILAYRLRTINRGHLLGALTPLYLAWAASHLLLVSAAGREAIAPEKHIQALAQAFETDKPYLVARWRWPDRFNP